MPTVPVRNLGAAGIVTDINPYDLPPNVFSAGVNVRFENGVVSRGPVSREVFNLTNLDAPFQPGHLSVFPSSITGTERLIITARDYNKVYELIGGTATNVTASGMAGATYSTSPITSCFLGAVTYLNRRTHVPFMKSAADATFLPLTGWDTGWRCGVLRSYKDFLIALDVRKGAVEYPQMIKWSDIAQFGAAPPSWDATLTTNSAGENILNEMGGRLVDGHAMRDTFMLYGENEVWAMTYVGGQFIFDFRKRFSDFGVVAPNCVVEVDGQHFVFGQNDIIVHDGVSKRSIAHGLVKDFVFRGLIRDLQHLCFVSHDPVLNEIRFCYPTQDLFVTGSTPTTGCNRAAAYNYRLNAWTFYDLPNVTSSANGSVPTSQAWGSLSDVSFDSIGGTYLGAGSVNDPHHLFASVADASQGITASRVVGFDLINFGRLTKPIVPELLKDAYVERVGIDLDEGGAMIAAYKSLLRVYPQIAGYGTVPTVRFRFGAADTPAGSSFWEDEQVYNPQTDYQLSTRRAGRYLSHSIRHTGYGDFAYSGFDAALTIRGKR